MAVGEEMSTETDQNKDESPQVSIVVPTRNSSRTLRACLESIRAQSIKCEIIVVDNGSDDSTPAIAQELSDQLISGGPERSAQRNLGFFASCGTVVGFVDSDMVLEPTVAQEALHSIKDGVIGVVIPEYTIGTGYWASVRAYERSMYLENENIEAARFFDRSVVTQLGGFNEQLTGGEDWDIDIRARQKGAIGRTTAKIMHDEGTLRYLETCRKKGYYAKGYKQFAHEHGMHTLVSITIDRLYLQSPKTLLTRKGIGLAALKLGELSAMLMVVTSQVTTDYVSTFSQHWIDEPGVSQAWQKLLVRVSDAVCHQDYNESN